MFSTIKLKLSTDDGVTTSPTSEAPTVTEDVIIPTVLVSVIVFSIITTASLSFLIYWKRRQSSLPHLDKHNKESEENSYSSSKNSRDSSPKGGDSFDPLYDEIKLEVHQNKAVDKENYKCSIDEDKNIDPNYSFVDSKASCQDSQELVNSSVKVPTKSHRCSEDNEDQPNDDCTTEKLKESKSKEYETHTYSLVDVKKKKENEHMKAHECNYPYEASKQDSNRGTPPPVPPHTPEMYCNDGDFSAKQVETVSGKQ